MNCLRKVVKLRFHLLFLVSISSLCAIHARADEQPPYDVPDPAASENFRNIYLSQDKLSLLTSLFSYTLSSSSNSLCIDTGTFCVDANNNQVLFGGGSLSLPSIAMASLNTLGFYQSGSSEFTAVGISTPIANFGVSGGSPYLAFYGNAAMNSKKLTALGAGTTAGDSVRFEQNKIIQIVYTVSTTATTSTSSTYAATNSSATITPTSASNNIIIIAGGTLRSNAVQTSPAYATLFRNTTNLGNSSDLNFLHLTMTSGTGNVNIPGTIIYKDSPATTSATTYTVRINNADNATTVAWGNGGVPTTLILMEAAP